MQYLLTEEELSALRAKAALADAAPSQADLQAFCTVVADNMPITHHHGEPRPWGCILTVKREHYCDRCPSRPICPHPHKHLSQ